MLQDLAPVLHDGTLPLGPLYPSWALPYTNPTPTYVHAWALALYPDPVLPACLGPIP